MLRAFVLGLLETLPGKDGAHARKSTWPDFLPFFYVCVCVFKRTRSISLLWLLGLWPPSSISGHMSHPLSLGALPHVCVCASMACYIYFFISICCFCFFLSFFETATTTAGAGSTRSPNSDVNQSSRLAPTHAGSDYTHFSLSLLFLSLSAS